MIIVIRNGSGGMGLLPEGAGAITEGGEDALSELFDVGHTLDAYVAVDKHQSFE